MLILKTHFLLIFNRPNAKNEKFTRIIQAKIIEPAFKKQKSPDEKIQPFLKLLTSLEYSFKYSIEKKNSSLLFNISFIINNIINKRNNNENK